MTIFGDTMFFALLAASILPAVLLGFLKKPIAPYGLLVSAAFIVADFWNTKISLVYLAAFLAIQLAVTYLFFKSRRKKKNKPLFYLAVALSIFPLVAYKIGAVFDANILGFLGISYITFKSVQVIIEIEDGIIKELSFFRYIYFMLFFPTFTSGPIDRSRRFDKDLAKPPERHEYAELLSKGLFYILLGAVYKFVLSALFVDWATFCTTLFGSQPQLPELAVQIINKYFYGFYLFFDFAGYSLLAVGTGYCFGIAVPKNFDKPFISVDIKEFWNRWHITLSFWLRDFVFTRFVMLATKKKWFRKNRLTTACAGYIVNMMLMGFWHGISPNYILYGLYHGILLAVTDVFQKKSKFYAKHKNNKLYRFVSWFLTFNLVILGFAIFASDIHF